MCGLTAKEFLLLQYFAGASRAACFRAIGCCPTSGTISIRAPRAPLTSTSGGSAKSFPFSRQALVTVQQFGYKLADTR